MIKKIERYLEKLEELERLDGVRVEVQESWTGTVYVEVSVYEEESDELREALVRISNHEANWELAGTRARRAPDFNVVLDYDGKPPVTAARLRDEVARFLGLDPRELRRGPEFRDICGIKARTLDELKRKLAKRFPELGEPVPGSEAACLALHLWNDFPLFEESSPVAASVARRLGYKNIVVAGGDER